MINTRYATELVSFTNPLASSDAGNQFTTELASLFSCFFFILPLSSVHLLHFLFILFHSLQRLTSTIISLLRKASD